MERSRFLIRKTTSNDFYHSVRGGGKSRGRHSRMSGWRKEHGKDSEPACGSPLANCFACPATSTSIRDCGNWTEVPHALSWGHPLQIWQQRHECAPSTSTARRRWCGGAASCELHPGSWSNTLTPECAHVADTLVRLQTVGGPPHTGLLTLKSSACQRPLALCICVQGAASCV